MPRCPFKKAFFFLSFISFTQPRSNRIQCVPRVYMFKSLDSFVVKLLMLQAILAHTAHTRTHAHSRIDVGTRSGECIACARLVLFTITIQLSVYLDFVINGVFITAHRGYGYGVDAFDRVLTAIGRKSALRMIKIWGSLPWYLIPVQLAMHEYRASVHGWQFPRSSVTDTWERWPLRREKNLSRRKRKKSRIPFSHLIRFLLKGPNVQRNNNKNRWWYIFVHETDSHTYIWCTQPARPVGTASNNASFHKRSTQCRKAREQTQWRRRMRRTKRRREKKNAFLSSYCIRNLWELKLDFFAKCVYLF